MCHRLYTISVVIALLALPSGCGDDDTECTTGVAADGSYTFAVGDTCLRGVTLRARRQGVWAGGSDAPNLVSDALADGGHRIELSAQGEVEGFELVVPDVLADRMLHQGYQSWSFTGTVLIPRSIPMDPDGAPLMEAARTGDPIHEARGVSFNSALFRNGSDGDVLIIATLSAKVANTGIAATYDGTSSSEITVVYGAQREPLPVDAGTSHSEALYIASAPTPELAMDMLSAQLVAEHAGDGFTPKKPPAGWFSWNEHFADIDETFILDHASKIETDLAPVGMTLVEIDDGWQIEWGDWQANARFPNGMAPIAADITGRGLVAGIWLAPFLVDLMSDAANSDPSLFVQGPNGTPLVHMRSGSTREYYVLDGTNPASMAIVTDEIQALAEAGYTFFKLDFLYAGALAGGRSQNVTGIQALRAGLEKIREVAGDNSIINGCGAPTLPLIGLADSLRIGPDTAFEGFDLQWSLVAAATRNLANRAHLFPLVWLDADQVQLRAPYTADEARAGAVSAALAGPAYSLGDDLLTLDPTRLATALDADILDIAGSAGPPRPIGLMDNAGDEVPASPVIEAFRYFEGYAVAPPSRFEIFGASGDAYEITFDWETSHSVTVDTLQP